MFDHLAAAKRFIDTLAYVADVCHDGPDIAFAITELLGAAASGLCDVSAEFREALLRLVDEELEDGE